MFKRKSISDIELKMHCQNAITKGWYKDRLLMDLKSKDIALGQPRLDRMWKECGGKKRGDISG